jgi:hypothetical protein
MNIGFQSGNCTGRPSFPLSGEVQFIVSKEICLSIMGKFSNVCLSHTRDELILRIPIIFNDGLSCYSSVQIQEFKSF